MYEKCTNSVQKFNNLLQYINKKQDLYQYVIALKLFDTVKTEIYI